ncbi:Unsaturated rhamnogalacturonyl hydrolase YteR [Tolypocladium ophioglossoides CBS 100239]|uniref:Unsaturated rhamnogalacturonyl hydrolase YteR n=1 Tax=Tolypocladium ophioglossoides (strain CBS 100239) TaxID=1163406 RepID=A0A0L0NEN9_TOLOC|nr:Unsaturated rhamnogalacturonyl hydrolase YteR [Tolypocladium ophioglossoides CBS 100239]
MHLSTIYATLAVGIISTATCSKTPHSRMMLDSVKIRQQGIISSGAASVFLESGILAQAILDTMAQYPKSDARASDEKYLGAVLDAASKPLRNATFYATRPLDRFSLASGIKRASKSGIPVSAGATAAYEAISASLSLQIRNPDGGFWYYVYPDWSYLDGMVSLLPFMAASPQPNETDIDLQISLLQSHCKMANSSLLVHGYDWSRTAVWANSLTGASRYVWGRSLGWFLAGMVQTYEGMDCADNNKGYRPICTHIRNTTIQISSKLVEYADPTTGAWWQLPTFPGRSGNFLESSSTALYIFSFLKGLRIGIIPAPSEKLKEAAIRAYNYTVQNFVVDLGYGNGTIGYDGTVAVCSLNSTATYEYYTTQPIVANSLLGEAAFILASLEVERLPL